MKTPKAKYLLCGGNFSKELNFPEFIRFPLVIAGWGISGQAAYQLLINLGAPQNQIFIYDQKAFPEDLPVKSYNQPDLFLSELNPKTILLSPGIPKNLPWINRFLAKGGSLTSELELAFHFLTTEKVISITGSLGKSTTTSLLGLASKTFDPFTFYGGNLGVPLSDYINQLDHQPRALWVILELSSYQLETFRNLISHFSIITYFTPNHLERYSSLKEYYESKWTLLKKTRGPIIMNLNSDDLVKFANEKLGFHQRNENTPDSELTPSFQINWTKGGDNRLLSYQLNKAALLGAHNQDNLALAALTAQLADWPSSSFEAMKSFPGLPHRLENIGIFNDILFINDSKATTISSVEEAIHSSVLQLGSFNYSLFVLLGGRDKNLPWEKLSQFQFNPQLKYIFFGECGEVVQNKSGLPGPYFKHLESALNHLFPLLKKGDVLLLSPGGTSLDEFQNFEERGLFFKNHILKHLKDLR